VFFCALSTKTEDVTYNHSSQSKKQRDALVNQSKLEAKTRSRHHARKRDIMTQPYPIYA